MLPPPALSSQRLYTAPSVLEGHSLTTLTPVYSEEVINSQVRTWPMVLMSCVDGLCGM